MITASVWPNQLGFGDAAFLARQLGLQDEAAAWSLDANCGSTPVVLQIASALVQQGDYHNVLAVISCSNSRFYNEDDTMSWFLGDGAGAFVVSVLEGNQGVLGTKTVHTSALYDVISPICTVDEQGNPQVRMQMGKHANALGETALDLLLICCKDAMAAADVTLNKIDFFLFNTPTAWMADFYTRMLSISPERTINLYPQYANIGPVLTVANLYHAAQLGKIREDDLVLIYGSGAAGAACASVMRWGNVALGREPV
jgi:3-oxoacyl-[acyl-carrier-protein] synthase-3